MVGREAGLVVHLPNKEMAAVRGIIAVRGQRCVDLAMEDTGSIHIFPVLEPLDQTIVPPRSQAFQRPDYTVTQKVLLRYDQPLYTAKGSPTSAECC